MIEIYFAGLIVFESMRENESTLYFDRRNKSHAKLIPSDDHEPLISINGGRSVPLTTPVSFDNLGVGPANTTRLFDRYVPHLDDLTTGGIDLTKGRRGLIVYLPNGKLTVAKFYPDMACLTLPEQSKGELFCLPKITVLLVEPNGDPMFIEFNDQRIELENGNRVLIQNSTNQDPVPCGSHWKTHAHATTDRRPARIAGHKDTTKCCRPEIDDAEPLPNACHVKEADDLIEDVFASYHQHESKCGKVDCPDSIALARRSDTHSECTNSQWP